MTDQSVNEMIDMPREKLLLELYSHVRKYLLLYTILVLILGVIAGYILKSSIASNKVLLKNLILTFAILTLYPSMIQLRTDGLAKGFKHHKAILSTVAYIFILAPSLAILFAGILENHSLQLGYVASNVVPASSASVGYVLIAEGNIELATALVIISLIGAIPLAPLYLSLYGHLASVSVPIDKVLISIIYALVVPFIAGQLTRYPLLKKKGRDYVNKEIKPYLSLATMLSMLVLIFLLIMGKAGIIVKKPMLAGEIIGAQTVIILVVLSVSLLVSKLIKINYEDHQGIAFISVTKNESVAAIITTLALGGAATLPPAIIPAIQPVLCIIYLHLDKAVKRFLTIEEAITPFTSK